jgi:type III secretion protein C
MNFYPLVISRLSLALTLSLSAFFNVNAAAVPWPDGPYSYFANNVKLETALTEFADSFSLTLKMSPSVDGTVNGKFTTKTPTEFIARMAGVYGFVWYAHAGTLFVSNASDRITRAVPVPVGSVKNLRQALTDLGVLESRFGWGELGESGFVLISGPPTYIDMVETTVRSLPPSAGAQQIAVYRLKYASADDRTTSYRGKEISTPGLASVLRDLISGNGAIDGAENQAITSIVSPLRASVVVNPDSSVSSSSASSVANAVSTKPVQSRPEGQRVKMPTIRSEPRLNALIIQDIPERMPIYEKLVALLDVPTSLIEIEAMIIDVNSDKAKNLGINWSGRAGRFASSFGPPLGSPGNGTLSLGRLPSGIDLGTGTLAPALGNYFLSQIQLLESDGDAKIQSRPSVLTTENTGAILDLSETFYIRLQGERVANVTPITSGTTLKVTPRVIISGKSRMVQLTIDINDGRRQDQQVDMLPTVSNSMVSTQAIVMENETLVIAGHSSDESINSVQRVPVLGSIPGLGLLFSNQNKIVKKHERLFLIKPRIITLPSAVDLEEL